MRKEKILSKLDELEAKYKSQRMKAICLYAYEMVEYLEDVEEFELKTLRKTLLNGAESFMEYSFGGCSLIYTGDISERLPKTYTKIGEQRHDLDGYLMEAQGHYLYEAYNLVFRIICEEE